MYDRAPRTLQLSVGCTPDHIGPGTYDHRQKKYHEEGYAPFLSLANRGDVFANDENPGPGHYDVRKGPSTIIKGGSTLANKALRFSQKLSNVTPGPGAYELYKSQSARLPPNEVVKSPRQNGFRYNRKSLPPSIPDPKFAYGFEEDDTGILVPQQAPIRDDTIGPAFYSASFTAESDASKMYHGIHFGKYSSKRTDFSGKPGPGPSDYDPNDPIKLETHHINMKTWERRPELQVLRYPDNMLKTSTKDGVPGPGRYSIKRELDPEPSKSEITGLDYDRPPFGSQTKRFDFIPSDAPGPTTYNDKVMTAFNASQTKTTSLKQNPFNQTSARFISLDYKSRSVPGPGQYRLSGFADENLRRAVVESGKKPPFNVASIRRLDMTRKDDFITPGPSSYDIRTQPFKPKLEHPSANFVSSTARDSLLDDIPGPTAYDVPRAYQALTTQHRQPPRTKNARKRQTQFLSAAKRSFAGDPSIDTPGPGAYDSFISTHTHGYAPVRDSRFRNEIPKLPGPADYELSPLFQDTVLRGTFNSTLNNPILAKLQNRASRDEKAAAAAATASGSTGQIISGTGGELATHV